MVALPCEMLISTIASAWKVMAMKTAGRYELAALDPVVASQWYMFPPGGPLFF
jgi:hypothetical protein